MRYKNILLPFYFDFLNIKGRYWAVQGVYREIRENIGAGGTEGDMSSEAQLKHLFNFRLGP